MLVCIFEGVEIFLGGFAVVDDVFDRGGGVYGFEKCGDELRVKEDCFGICFAKGVS